jgi:hypothetical protein
VEREVAVDARMLPLDDAQATVLAALEECARVADAHESCPEAIGEGAGEYGRGHRDAAINIAWMIRRKMEVREEQRRRGR